MRPRLPRLLLDRDRRAGSVKFHHAIGFGASDLVGEDGGARPRLRRALQDRRQPMAVKDVVAQHKSDIVAADKVARDQKGLRQPVGPGLFRIANRQSPLAAVLE